MGAALTLITIGIIYAASSLKGISVVDFLNGVTGDVLDPKGGRGGPPPVDPSMDPATAPSLSPTPPTASAGPFKGPNAVWLNQQRQVAHDRFKLTDSQICRPQNATYGAPNSLHKQCRAIDLVGSVANRVAFARYVKAQAARDGINAEVFCDQAGMYAPGYDHSDHVHLGA